MVHSPSHISNPHIIKKLPFDTLNDFTPIGLHAAQTELITAHPSLPVKSVKELVALAKARPSQILYASSGTGTFSHLAMALIDSMTGSKMVNVPYKGGGPATTAKVSGETQIIAGTPEARVTHAAANLAIICGGAEVLSSAGAQAVLRSHANRILVALGQRQHFATRFRAQDRIVGFARNGWIIGS